MGRLSDADRVRISLSSGYFIAFLLVAFALWAGWLVAILVEELGR